MCVLGKYVEELIAKKKELKNRKVSPAPFRELGKLIIWVLAAPALSGVVLPPLTPS
jgi:hypothetical protein